MDTEIQPTSTTTYGYDGNGNLATVTYPAVPQQTMPPRYTYTYDTAHRLTGGTDPDGNPLPTTLYDAGGRLQSVSETVLDYLGNATTYTTSYAYNLTNNSTTITYPADANGNVGTATMVFDSYGMLLSTTDPLGHKTTNLYDVSHNLKSTTDPLLHTTSYTYDPNGNRTSVTYPQPRSGGSLNTTTYTQYNQYSGRRRPPMNSATSAPSITTPTSIRRA